MTMMMIVISALVGAVILSYCLTGKKTKKPAIIAGIVFAVIMIILGHNSQNYDTPPMLSPQAAEAFTIKFGEPTIQTPFEEVEALFCILVFAIFIAGVAICEELEDKESLMQIKRKCLFFLVVVVWYSLSLRLGIGIKLIPYIKPEEQPKPAKAVA